MKEGIIEESVMKKISSGKLRMRSKTRYIILGLLSIVAIILLVVLATYFISVSSLWLRIQIAQGPAYGANRNLALLLNSFPWWAFLLSIVSIIGIIYFVSRSGRMYKIRLAYLITIVIAFILLIGFVFSFSVLPGIMNGQRLNSDCLDNNSVCTPSIKGRQKNQ